ncbi:hypothetical protein C8J30_11939 [Rhodobacter viridis]|uniref:Uncharacterized protein n=1 Tax=Rhodobacter viridis TaxID=1054202 RepID=A0A318U5L8_9RHOB|nr:hypothetical protein C8J30_11939 [Rhodobacter viridis]
MGEIDRTGLGNEIRRDLSNPRDMFAIVHRQMAAAV